MSATRTLDILRRSVGIVLDDHLNEVHALDDEALEHEAVALLGEHEGDGELERALDQGDKRVGVRLQEVQELKTTTKHHQDISQVSTARSLTQHHVIN